MEAEARNARSKLRKELEQKVAKIEEELALLDKRKGEVVIKLQDENTYGDPVKFRALNGEAERIEGDIQKKTAQWEKATEEYEAAKANG